MEQSQALDSTIPRYVKALNDALVREDKADGRVEVPSDKSPRLLDVMIPG